MTTWVSDRLGRRSSTGLLPPVDATVVIKYDTGSCLLKGLQEKGRQARASCPQIICVSTSCSTYSWHDIVACPGCHQGREESSGLR